MLWWLLSPLVAYLIGSLSFAYFAGKIKGVDLREHGSGNLGATMLDAYSVRAGSSRFSLPTPAKDSHHN